MSVISSWLHFLKCQKELVFHKLKIYGISKKVEDNYRMIGEEVYLFSQKPKSHKSVLSQSRVKTLLDEVNKDHEIIAETEKEIFALKDEMMENSSGKDEGAKETEQLVLETNEPKDTTETAVSVETKKEHKE